LSCFGGQGLLAEGIKFLLLTADKAYMKLHTPGPWAIKKNGNGIGVVGHDSSCIAQLPINGIDRQLRLSDAHLIAAAPQLLDVCKNLNEILENNLIVTAEGFKINDTHLRERLLDAILRAEGYRKNPDPL
jgi:hypothetical protein